MKQFDFCRSAEKKRHAYSASVVSFTTQQCLDVKTLTSVFVVLRTASIVPGDLDIALNQVCRFCW